MLAFENSNLENLLNLINPTPLNPIQRHFTWTYYNFKTLKRNFLVLSTKFE